MDTSAQRVLSRFLAPYRVRARALYAKEFGSPQELNRYLKEHPRADKSKHTVRQKDKTQTSESKELFDSKEVNKLSDDVKQPVRNPEKLFQAASEAHKHQIKWLNQGKGLDKALGATAVRGDRGEKPDYDKPGPIILIGPMKKRDRVDEKVRTDYGGDYSRIGDLVRASVAVDKLDQLSDVMTKLRQSGLKLARKPKDRFARPTESGYRDIIMNVEYPNKHVGELQLHLKPILQAKKAGHKAYEVVRSIEGRAKEEGRTTMTPQETQIVEEANRKQRKLYDNAWKKATGKATTKTAADKSATSIKYYDYDGVPAYWERGSFPKLLVGSKGERVIYELEKFFNEAVPLSLREYNDLRRDTSGRH